VPSPVTPARAAAIGAAAGGMGGVGGNKQAKQQAEAQAQPQKQQAPVNKQMDAFKKAHTACVEGKKYTVA
jgi:hypothetical protein